jgi:hypothetical protein
MLLEPWPQQLQLYGTPLKKKKKKARAQLHNFWRGTLPAFVTVLRCMLGAQEILALLYWDQGDRAILNLFRTATAYLRRSMYHSRRALFYLIIAYRRIRHVCVTSSRAIFFNIYLRTTYWTGGLEKKIWNADKGRRNAQPLQDGHYLYSLSSRTGHYFTDHGQFSKSTFDAALLVILQR